VTSPAAGWPAWIFDALGVQGNDATQIATQIGDRVTTRSYQFTADVAALGPHGRLPPGAVVFDTSQGPEGPLSPRTQHLAGRSERT